MILVASRDAMEWKLLLLDREATAIKMEIHHTKSQYMVINSKDDEPFILRNIVISHTDKYVYLGTPIINASLKNHVKAHINSKQDHLMKFSASLKKNKDAPFAVKELAFKSALSSAVLYGCESWLCNNHKFAVSAILSAEKQLLAVRNQTCSDLVQVELGYPEIKTMIKENQIKFLEKLFSRADFEESPTQSALQLSLQAGSQAGKYVNSLMQAVPGSFKKDGLKTLRSKITESDSSRRKTYCELNSHLSRHPMYSANIPEHERVAFTRLRLGSHWLKIETGRWSRIPEAERLCKCGSVQNEKHVLLNCPESSLLRKLFPTLNFDSLKSLMDDEPKNIAKYCQLLMEKYDRL